jgi:hypothetical protein
MLQQPLLFSPRHLYYPLHSQQSTDAQRGFY